MRDYYDKLEYWSEQLKTALSDKDIDQVTRCIHKLHYFGGKELRLEVDYTKECITTNKFNQAHNPYFNVKKYLRWYRKGNKCFP